MTAEIGERRDLERRVGTLVLAGNPACQSVSRLEQRRVDGDPIADHLGDRDRLADRTSQAEDHRRCDSGPGVREDDPADHLPARRAQGQRPVLELAWDAEEELPAEARDDRDHHDRQDQDRREHVRADSRLRAEDRQEAQRPVQCRPQGVDDERPEDEDAPETEYDGRDRRQQLDERAYDGTDPAGRELRQEERDRDRDRRRQEQSTERRDRGAEDERPGAEELLARARIPGLGRQELEAEPVHRGPGVGEHLPCDQDQEDEPGQRRRERDDVEDRVPRDGSGPAAGGRRGRLHGSARLPCAQDSYGWTLFSVALLRSTTYVGIGWKTSAGPYCWPVVSAHVTNGFSRFAWLDWSRSST